MRTFAFILIFLVPVLFFSPVTAMSKGQPVTITGVVTALELNVRNAPSRHAAVAGIIKKGDKVKIYKITGGIGGWLKVTCNGVNGYIRNRPIYIKLVKIKRKKSGSYGKNQLRNKSGHNNVKQDKQKDRKLDKKQKKPETIQDQIKIEAKKLNEFTEKEIKIIDGLNDIDQALSRMRRQVLSIRDEMDKLNREIDKASAAENKLLSEIKRNKTYAEARLKSFYKMKMIGVTELFTMPDSVFDFIVQQNYLKRIIESDMTTIDTEIKERNALTFLSRQLAEKKKEKHALGERIDDNIRIMKKESLRRKAILKEIKSKKNLGFAAIASLKQAAQALDVRIKAIKAVSSIQKGASFADFRGNLEMPVKGKIISKFGTARNSDSPSFTFQSGIDIKANRGEPVRSVFRGRIIFAQWLKGYGNIIIIDHGDNYYTLYAHVDEIFKKKGSLIDRGDVIATAGDTGSMKGTCLHFEVRFHGKPVNPVKWLKKGV